MGTMGKRMLKGERKRSAPKIVTEPQGKGETGGLESATQAEDVSKCRFYAKILYQVGFYSE
jgi:hypothetical protein